jgi:hypothetical protein
MPAKGFLVAPTEVIERLLVLLATLSIPKHHPLADRVLTSNP